MNIVDKCRIDRYKPHEPCEASPAVPSKMFASSSMARATGTGNASRIGVVLRSTPATSLSHGWMGLSSNVGRRAYSRD